jgi:hypothetical protein
MVQYLLYNLTNDSDQDFEVRFLLTMVWKPPSLTFSFLSTKKGVSTLFGHNVLTDTNCTARSFELVLLKQAMICQQSPDTS